MLSGLSVKTIFFTLALCFVLALAPTSCHGYTVHPGAINTFDSVTYDTINAAKAVIDTARTQYQAKVLPSNLVPLVDAIAKAYDAAYPAWNAWRDAQLKGASNAGQLLSVLNQSITALNAALDAFKAGK